MKARTAKRTKGEAVLISVAESIGSTLGTIAANRRGAKSSDPKQRRAHRGA
jgi:hypothetical protein